MEELRKKILTKVFSKRFVRQRKWWFVGFFSIPYAWIYFYEYAKFQELQSWGFKRRVIYSQYNDQMEFNPTLEEKRLIDAKIKQSIVK
ncbi:hypothetical protein pb186bvf_005766 [Paramecium bursaria]